jgi:hypothetical protein
MEDRELRYEAAKAELLRLARENPSHAEVIVDKIARLAKNLRDCGSDVSKYQITNQMNVAKRRHKFDLKQSQSYQYFQRLNWTRFPHRSLLGIIKIVAKEAGIERLLDRDSKRGKWLLFQWIDEHWDVMGPYLNETELEITIHPFVDRTL